MGYGGAILRRVRTGASVSDDGGRDGKGNELDLFGDVMRDLTARKFLQACIDENDRYMSEFDPRLLRPRVIPTLGKIAFALAATIESVEPLFRYIQSKLRQSG